MADETDLTHAARRAYDKIAEIHLLDLPPETMRQMAAAIDAEYADVITALQLVSDDYAKHGELKKSTIMRMQSALAYVWKGEDGLAGLFDGAVEEG